MIFMKWVGKSYYGDSYPFLGGTDREITNRIYNSITVVPVIYAAAAIILRICDKKARKRKSFRQKSQRTNKSIVKVSRIWR